jgi:3-deoxy-D-manno-octulosonic-acid transferase
LSPPGTPWSLRLYALATGLAQPIAPMLLRRRVGRGKEDAARLNERLGRASAPRPAGPLVWLHGASVGEGLSLLPLVDGLIAARPELAVLVTSGTRTSAELLARRLPAQVVHQYLPVDGPRAVGRFLDHWRPDAAVFVESELWPNLLLQARRRGVKLALLSAKLSDASFRGWSRLPGAAAALLGGFDLILAQDAPAADRIAALGGRPAGVGDLKFGAEPLPADAAALERLKGQVGARPVILAASTHPGEDEMVLERFTAVAAAVDAGPLLVIIPRHPQRGGAVAALAARAFKTALQSGGGTCEGAQVFVADGLGELGLWFRVARLAIMGGGFVPGVGGHNPLEPARLSCPFVSGAQVANWAGVYRDLEQLQATACLPDAAGLDPYLLDALLPSKALADMAARALAYVERRDADARSVAGRVLELLP